MAMTLFTRLGSAIARLESDTDWRERYWWPAIVLLAVCAYLYALGSPNIPNIGDESPYILITRLTAASGHWLPLQGFAGMQDTKPPLLFWQGMLSTDFGRHWTLLALRWPIVVMTFIVAALSFALGRRLGGRREAGYLAALAFLAFASTFQHGRPFLTNMPESLFLFLPFWALLYFREQAPRWGWRLWLALGVSIGIATLYKSFVLVAPIGLAFAWYCWMARDWHLKQALRRDAPGIALAVIVALAIFSLWFVLDPDPSRIFHKFVIGQNLGKLETSHYLGGLFAGTYSVWRVWLGDLTNAGLLAPLIIWLAIVSWRDRKQLRFEEKALWVFVFAFLLVYTIPSQRQENYILPTVPALAVLLSLRWHDMRSGWFYLFNLPTLLGVVLLALMLPAIAHALPPHSYSVGNWLVPMVALLFLLAAYVRRSLAPVLFLPTVLLAFLTFGNVLRPFDGPLGRYSPASVAALAGTTVYAPSDFPGKYDRQRFLLPHTEIVGYKPRAADAAEQLLQQGKRVAIDLPYDAPLPQGDRLLGSRLMLHSRLSAAELWAILFRHRTEHLLLREAIVQRRKSD
jgi:4-amino-4-deoxy-L-arabinose transferase-like glycosyltransferase